jgi:mono/diheme cytochrome c family protein
VTDFSLAKYYAWFTELGLGGVLVVAGYYRDDYREWKDYQRKYIQGGNPPYRPRPRRKWWPNAFPWRYARPSCPTCIGVDRCTTCHLAVEDPSYGGYPQPLSYHPLHEQHPFERFGCTICHRGQGRATTTVDAHGNVPHWDEPMLPMQYIQASCGQCHEAADNPAAPELAQGEQVFENSGCRGCHKLGGTGGIIGPELDKVGARRSPEWLKKHFIAPASATPGSIMPPQNFSETNLEAIVLFMLSQTGESASGYYSSMKVLPTPAKDYTCSKPEAATAATPSMAMGAKLGRPWTTSASVALRNG